MSTPYAFRQHCAAVRPMRFTWSEIQQATLDGSYCIDAPELLPAGSHEPSWHLVQQGLPTLTPRDL